MVRQYYVGVNSEKLTALCKMEAIKKDPSTRTAYDREDTVRVAEERYRTIEGVE